MKLQSASILGAITLSIILLSACGSKEEKTEPKAAEVKPATEQPAPVQEAAPEPAQEEPALVPIQSLSEEKAAPAETPAAPVSAVEQESSGPFVIQVSIQASRKAANNVVSKLSDQGIKAYVAEVENPGELEGTFYRVRVGYFSTIANAQQFGKEVLAPQGYAGWVDNRKNDRIGQPGASEDM
jgi:cell division septation protein DedD